MNLLLEMLSPTFLLRDALVGSVLVGGSVYGGSGDQSGTIVAG